MMKQEEFRRTVAEVVRDVLGAMVSDRYPGNPDYVTSEDIEKIADALYARLTGTK